MNDAELPAEGEATNVKVAYLCDSLVNWKLTPTLRRSLEGRGFQCVPDKFDVQQDETDGWTLTRSKSNEEIEEEIGSADVVLFAYPNYTATGRRAWFETSMAVEMKKPIVVVRYASKFEQPELRRLLSHCAWLDVRFDHAAGAKQAAKEAEMLAEPSTLKVTVEEPETSVLVDARVYWDGLLKAVEADPRILHQVEPRRFEEFVAHLLEKDGFRVELTPRSRDGGFDIMAYQESLLGSHLFLVECKRYGLENPVGVEILRGLYGSMMLRRATAAAVVTTSRFTRGAIKEAALVPYHLQLRDFTHVQSWVSACHAARA